MKTRIAITGLFLAAFMAALFLLSKLPGGAPVQRVSFSFVSFTNSAAGHSALFSISNHPQYLFLHGAVRIEAKTTNGWTAVCTTNVPVQFLGAALAVPLSDTGTLARVVFDLQEGTRGTPQWLEDILERFPSHDPHVKYGPHFFVTNERSTVAMPR